MATERILIVDDEETLCEVLKINLENEGYDVDIAFSAEQALTYNLKGYSLILLDIMMGEISGIKMAKMLKADVMTADIPIIFCTARDSEDDMVMGLNLGADDYITKPFSIQEVIARVKAVLRRVPEAAPASNHSMIEEGRLRIDLDHKLVYVCGKQVAFSKKEFEVLSLLASRPGEIFSRDDLITELWKDAPYVLDRTVDVHIARIRSKLGEIKNYITNRSGYGYIFNPVK